MGVSEREIKSFVERRENVAPKRKRSVMETFGLKVVVVLTQLIKDRHYVTENWFVRIESTLFPDNIEMVGMWVSNTVRNMRFGHRTTDSTHVVLKKINGTILTFKNYKSYDFNLKDG